MMNEFIYRSGKFLRCGYTTGSCAAAASKAAAICVLSGEFPDSVTLPTPKGITLTLDVIEPEIAGSYAKCAIKKTAVTTPISRTGYSFSRLSQSPETASR